MKRYGITLEPYDGSIIQRDDGIYVYQSEAQAKIDALTTEIERLQKECKRLRALIEDDDEVVNMISPWLETD